MHSRTCAAGGWKSFLALGLVLLGTLAPLRAYADYYNGVDLYEEYGKRVKAAQQVSALTDSVFGDHVSLYNGATTFEVTDFSIPGNNTLPVALRRQFVVQDHRQQPQDGDGLHGFGDWDLEVPYIDGTFTGQNGWTLYKGSGASDARCSDNTDGPYTFVPSPDGVGEVTVDAIWNGNQLHIPGQGDQELLANTQSKSPAYASRATYKWVTKGNWKLSCIGNVTGLSGEGFVAVSPTGVKYTFNYAVMRSSSAYVWKFDSKLKPEQVARVRIFLLATHVEDRFGNWVDYNYDSSGHLTEIASSDGRSITLTWSGDQISSATSALGTWHYGYTTASWTNQFGTVVNWTTLSTVTQPDRSNWSYAIVSGAPRTNKEDWPDNEPLNSQTHCQSGYIPNAGSFKYKIVSPSGATAVYDFEYQRHWREMVPWGCFDDPDPDHNYPQNVTDFFDNFSVTSKQVSGPGLPDATWSYDYGDNSGSYYSASAPYGSFTAEPYIPPGSCTSCALSKVVTVTGPIKVMQYTFGVQYARNEGQLLETQIENPSGHVLSYTTNTYISSDVVPNEPFPDIAGQDLLFNYVSPMGNRIRPVVSTQITEDSTAFTTATNAFDAFARTASQTESSSLGYSKTDTTTYADDLNSWVLGLVTQTATNGIVATQTDYDSLDQPEHQYSFGRLVSTSGWNSDGTLAAVTDGDGNTTNFFGWTRGLPSKVTFADGTSESAAITDAGWITAVTDEDGFTTNYAYDAMGRLAQIGYPAGDNVAWNATSISFAPAPSSEFGIPAGHWDQVVQTGNGKTITVFDAFWHPLVTEHYDVNNESGTLSQVVQQYDAGGRTVFRSYPTNSATSYTQSLPGIHTSYDVLNRATEVDQDSSLGGLPTTTQYLPGFSTEVTDPRGNSTTTSYLAYGDPTTQWPVSMTAPEGELTKITRDVFGKPLSVTRTGTATGSSSLTRSYVYNGYQQLCERVEPETGATAFGYDGAGNLSWSAAGLTASADCYSDSQASGSGRMVTRTYDTRNRLHTIAYPDGYSNTSFGYYPDGLLQTQAVSNGGFPATTSYMYDKRRLLTQETLSLPSTPAFAIGYGYDTNGHLSAIAYPDGRTITYVPNALGQPTQVVDPSVAGESYATNVHYYPNGAVAGFTYGSCAVHTMTENERGLVGRATDALNGTAGMDSAYNYDSDGNVAAITDYLPGSVGNVDMTYDHLDRLTEADSPMFGGTGKAVYQYDLFNNLASAEVGSQGGVVYAYNVDNQLAELISPASGAVVASYLYDPQGNLANKNGQVYQFDMANRMKAVPGLVSYRYDASGRRVQKVELAAGETLDSDYSRAGELMYQWDPATLNATDYIYLGGTLVARVVGNKSDVIGNIDGAPTAGNPVVGGWACATGITDPISVEIFAGPLDGGGTSLGTLTANQSSEPAVASSCGTSGTNYRFTFTLTQAMRAQYAGQAIYVYGDSPVGNGNNELSGSGQYAVPPDPGAPPAPASITVPASSSTGSVTVSWSGISTATSYVLQQQLNGGTWTQAYSGSATSANLNGLGNGSYVYRVQACNSAGCSAPTTSTTLAVALIPAPPASISVPSSSYVASFAVSWSASASASNYVLEENVDGGNWGVANSGDVTSYTVAVSSSGNYKFQVAACGTGGCSDFTTSSNVAVTLPPASAPSLSGPSSSISGTFTLSWNTVAGVTRYQLQQTLNGTVQTVYNAGGTSWSSSNLANGTYHYQVLACNAAGCQGSNEIAIQVLQPPSAAPSLSGPSSSTSGTFTLNWNTVASATSYKLSQGLNGTMTVPYNAAGTSWSSSGLGNGTYTYRVFACNVAGCGPASNTITVAVLHVPAVPASLTATPSSVAVGGSVSVSWSAVGSATSYDLQHTLEKADGTTTTSVSSEGTATSLTIQNAGPAGSLHTFNARACNAAGCSGWSNTGGFSVTGSGGGRIQAVPASAGSAP